ncbi:peptide methionine sulfoxide reductase [Rothia dentocariosa]|nr:peptide methionine sulfoxide reductase [Rothia dentocariosa]
MSTIKSGFTAGAKAYGGNSKNTRGESEAPGATLQTGTSGTVAADEQ